MLTAKVLTLSEDEIASIIAGRKTQLRLPVLGEGEPCYVTLQDTVAILEPFVAFGPDGLAVHDLNRAMGAILRDGTLVPRDKSVAVSPSGPLGYWREPWMMPDWAVRLRIKPTSIRTEKLQDISEVDACKTGGFSPITRDLKVPKFAKIWDRLDPASIYGWTWSSNPMVQVVDFEKVIV